MRLTELYWNTQRISGECNLQLVKYNPIYNFYKSTVGAVPQGTELTLRVLIDSCMHPSAVHLVVYDENDYHQEFLLHQDVAFDNYCSYVVTFSMPKGLYWYYFEMSDVPYERYIGIASNLEASLFFENVKAWQLSVYEKIYDTPKWLNDGVMYQIMVDRFAAKGKVVPTEDKLMRKWGEQPYYQELDGSVSNRDFFGGTIKGIISKLPYLASLGVTTLYLNPIFSAYSNHKYDTEDYEQIDSMFGTKQDFAQLTQKATKLGMSIILDGVFNHVGCNSKYFNKSGKYGEGGAYRDVNSPYRQWFCFDHNNNYESWWGFETLPRINAFNPDVQQYLCGEEGIVPYWIKQGASGWRLDVVDEIADCMLDKIVASAKSAKKDCAIIGEVWEDASNKVDYGVRRRFFEGRQLDSVMNYPLKDAIIDFVRYGNVYAIKYAVFNQLNNYPLYIRNNLMNILGTHDTKRILTALAGDNIQYSTKDVLSRTMLTDSQYHRGIQLVTMAVVLQYTMFGFPCVYYGDEVGMEGYGDPFCRGCFPWGGENKTLQDFYVRMGQLRKMKVFANGSFELLTAEEGLLVFRRQHQPTNQQVIVAVNRSAFAHLVELDGSYKDYLTGRNYKNNIDVQPDQCVILIK